VRRIETANGKISVDGYDPNDEDQHPHDQKMFDPFQIIVLKYKFKPFLVLGEHHDRIEEYEYGIYKAYQFFKDAESINKFFGFKRIKLIDLSIMDQSKA